MVPAIAFSNVLAIHFLVVDNKEHIVNRIVFTAAPISLAAGYLFAREHGAPGIAAGWVAVEWLVAIGIAVIIDHHYKRFQRS